MPGNSFFMNMVGVGESATKFGQQATKMLQSQAITKALGPKVQGAWIGGDADEFNADIFRKLMPKYEELALAFQGIQMNLGKATETVSSSDKKAAGLAQGFADLCSKIYP